MKREQTKCVVCTIPLMDGIDTYGDINAPMCWECYSKLEQDAKETLFPTTTKIDHGAPFKTGQAWIDEHYAAGSGELGASCNPIKRELYLYADKSRLVLKCRDGRETKLIKDMLHDHIERLPSRKAAK